MKPDRYVSTTAFRGLSLPDVLHACAKMGIDGVELGGNVFLDAAGLTLLEGLRRDGCRFLVHNYFPPPETPFVLNLATDSLKERLRTLEHCQRSLDLTLQLGASFYSVHAGFAAKLAPGDLGKPLIHATPIPRAAAYASFVEAMGVLCDNAAALGLKVLVENNVLGAFNLIDDRNDLLLLVSPEEIVQFCQDAAHPALGVLLDLGHVNVSSRTLGIDRRHFVDRVAPWIGAFHISANDGYEDTNQAFEGDDWFMPLLRLFPSTPRVIEVCGARPDQLQRCWDAMEA